MSSAYLYNQVIVVEPIVKPHNCTNDKDDCLILKMYEPKDLDQNEEPESLETGTGREPGIEFLKGVTADEPASLTSPQLLPLIHNLPGATTIYNSYKSVFQNWKNSTPKLVQYPASELEVVVYRKNGQVDTLRTGASSNGQKYSKLDNGADKVKVASIDNSQSRILSVGLKQLELGANSQSSNPKNENNILYQSSSGSPTPPPASPFHPSEFRFIYNQGVCESLKNNGEERPDDAAPKSKLIPDLKAIVTDLLKNPENPKTGSQPSSLAQEVVDIRREYELGAAKATTELDHDLTPQPEVSLFDVEMNSAFSRGKNCRFMVYGPQARLSLVDDYIKKKTSSEKTMIMPALLNENESKTEYINFEKPIKTSSSPIVDLWNGNISLEDQSESELKTSSAMVQTAHLELVATSTQTNPEHTELDSPVKPPYEDFSCQVEMNSVILKDIFSQCETDCAEFSCQVEIKPVVKDSDVQCQTESAEFSCQVEIPVIGKDTSVQCKPECDSKEIQTPPLCCEELSKKINEANLKLLAAKDAMMTEIQRIEKKKEDELSESKIYATINRFVNSQRSSKESMNELEKEVDSLKEVVQQSSASFGLNESSDYFEDVWLPPDDEKEAAVVIPDFD